MTEAQKEYQRERSRASYAKHRETRQAKIRAYAAANPEKGAERQARFRAKSSEEERMWQNAKARAVKQGVPFSIEVSDIVIPDACPALGVPFVRGSGKANTYSPTLDKIVPSRGYVPGNVQVLSNRANRIKSDATAVEVMKVALLLMAQVKEPCYL